MNAFKNLTAKMPPHTPLSLWRVTNENRLLLRFLMMPCLALACKSGSLKQILKNIWQPREILDPRVNVVISVSLTIIVTQTKKLNSLFYLWLLFMVFVVNDFDVQLNHPQVSPWYRECCFCLAIVQTCVTVFFALKVENSACSICSRKRFSLADVTGEARNSRPVYFVSTPAFGSPLLNRRIKRLLDRGNALLARGYVDYVTKIAGRKLSDKEKKMLLSDPAYMARFIEASGCLLSIPILFHGLESPSSLLSLPLGKRYSLLLIIMGRNMQTALLWTPWDLVCHHALEVGGILYELKRSGGLDDSIELQKPPRKLNGSKDRGKMVLSRTQVGKTFFNHDEILQCGDELIQISPNYDLITYNCQALRYNLFRRILDDNTSNVLRTDWSYEHPNGLLIPMIFSVFTDFDPFSNFTTISGLLRGMLGIIHFDHMLKGITYGTSTAYGRQFCFRRAGLLVGAMLLFSRVGSPSLASENEERPSVKRVLVVLLYLQWGLTSIAWLFQVGRGYAQKNKKELESLRLRAITRVLVALVISILMYVEKNSRANA